MAAAEAERKRTEAAAHVCFRLRSGQGRVSTQEFEKEHILRVRVSVLCLMVCGQAERQRAVAEAAVKAVRD